MPPAKLKLKKELVLSVIMPAYKEEKTIIKDLLALEEVLRHIRLPYEIICVVDGSPDKTLKRARTIESSTIRVLSYFKNMGKGYAVRHGMTYAKGDYVALIDAGMEIDPNGISMLLEHMEWYNADIIVGSKRHPASQVNYPFYRKMVSKVYQLFVRVFSGLNVSDTQVGLKLYTKKVIAAILPRLLIKGYAFDLEMLAVAHRLGFTRIYEAPIKLKFSFSALNHSVSFNYMLRAFQDTLAIIYRLRILRYYDDANKANWLRNSGA